MQIDSSASQSSHHSGFRPRPKDASGGARNDRAHEKNRICGKGGLDRYGRSTHPRSRKDRRFKSHRRGDENCFSNNWTAGNRRRGGEWSHRMQRELADRTESRIGAEGGGYPPVTRNGALMKMSDAHHLRDENQRRAENRDRARRCSTAAVESEHAYDRACRLITGCVKRFTSDPVLASFTYCSLEVLPLFDQDGESETSPVRAGRILPERLSSHS